MNGVLKRTIADANPTAPMIVDFAINGNGKKIFDVKISNPSYTADVVQQTDYYPYGMVMPNRNGSEGSYRYGFQGQEKDDEVKGAGESVNYKYRMHDPRIGRFFAVDPLTDSYPWNSPYSFSENVVINAVELEGLEKGYVYNVTGDGKSTKIKASHDYDNYNNFNQRVYRYFNSQGEMYKEMVQKLDDKGEVISYQTEMYPVDGKAETRDYYSLSQQTMGKKEIPWYRRGLLGDLEGGHDGANLGGWGGSAEKEIKYGTTALITILTAGAGAELIIAGKAFSWAGGKVIMDLSLNADTYINYTKDWSPAGKNVFNAINMMSSAYSIKSQVSKIANGSNFEFFDTAGNLMGELQFIDGAMQISGGNDFIKTFINLANGQAPNKKEETSKK
jgi:RHS repeat-associated protein